MSNLPATPSGVDPEAMTQAPSAPSVGVGSGASGVAPVSGSDAPVDTRDAPEQPVAPEEDKVGKSIAAQQDAAALAKMVNSLHGPKSSEGKAAQALMQAIADEGMTSSNANAVRTLIKSTRSLRRSPARQELLADLYEMLEP